MDMFAALAEPNRRTILEMLASQGQLPASAIAHRFRLSPPAISQHLKILREARLVRMEKRAQQRLYAIDPEALHELERWAQRMADQYEHRFAALERILKAEEQGAQNVKGRKDKQHGSSDQGKNGGHLRKDDRRR